MIVLVNYAFTTGEIQHHDSRLMSVRFENKPSGLDIQQFSEEQFIKWFPVAYPESKLDHVMATFPIEATYHDMVKTKIEVPMGWFTNEQKPFVDESVSDDVSKVSDLVLIDVDGKRETFVTGCWHYPSSEDKEGWWRVDEDFTTSIEPDNMRWSYLSLAKYDK